MAATTHKGLASWKDVFMLRGRGLPSLQSSARYFDRLRTDVVYNKCTMLRCCCNTRLFSAAQPFLVIMSQDAVQVQWRKAEVAQHVRLYCQCLAAWRTKRRLLWALCMKQTLRCSVILASSKASCWRTVRAAARLAKHHHSKAVVAGVI